MQRCHANMLKVYHARKREARVLVSVDSQANSDTQDFSVKPDPIKLDNSEPEVTLTSIVTWTWHSALISQL